MGLDITAYSRMRPVGLHTADLWDCHSEDHVRAFAYGCFTHSTRGLTIVRRETVPMAGDVVIAGCYEMTDRSKRYEFQAGSHPFYTAWRADLVRQFMPGVYDPSQSAGYVEPPDPAAPFYELIWFADNEGCIGPEAAADLAADFHAHAAAYRPEPPFDAPRCVDDDPTDWLDYLAMCHEKYASWIAALDLAADGGLVRFH